MGHQAVVENADEAQIVPPSVAEEIFAGLGTRVEIERELDKMWAVVLEFYRGEPDFVMRQAAGLSARCGELTTQLVRVEGRYREYKGLRTMQVRVLHEELERQNRIASRLLEVRRQDLALEMGVR